MKTVKDNYKRHEIKFVINNKEHLFFLKNKNLSKIFPDRIVESIYYDTNDLHFFHLSEEGITPRTKVRVRGYDNGELKIYKPINNMCWNLPTPCSNRGSLKVKRYLNTFMILKDDK